MAEPLLLLAILICFEPLLLVILLRCGGESCAEGRMSLRIALNQ